MINVLLACEESQATTSELRKLGYNAYSCDILPTSGPMPEYHIQDDIFNVIENHPIKWDLMIAHPPCTYLTTSGARWMYHPDDKHLPTNQRRPHPKHPNRRQQQQDAIDFFLKIMNSNIEYIAIENPVGVLSTKYRKPDCIVQPYHFGDEATKTTCFWLKNLPVLQPTNIVGKGEFKTWRDKNGKLKRQSKSSYNALSNTKTHAERRTLRSKTFQGMAEAMANQWGNYVCNKKNSI